MNHRRLMIALLGTVSAFAWASAGHAADLILPEGTVMQAGTELPAVSGINGKWEFDPGILTGSGQLRAAGSLSVPLSDRFGVQGDVMANWSAGNLVYGGALHAFTRDPAKYLVGLTAGIVVYPGSTLKGLGVEGELYMDRLSLEGWAGMASLDYVNPAMLDKTGFFAFADLAYYATDDFRLTVGGSDVLGDLSLHAGAEYLVHDFGAPISFTADARLHTGGNYSVTVGIKGYFGGNDDGKTLIDRHRQDDPRNRAVDFFNGAGSAPYDVPEVTTYSDPESSAEACVWFGGEWFGGEAGYCAAPNLYNSPDQALCQRWEQYANPDLYHWYWDTVDSECHVLT